MALPGLRKQQDLASDTVAVVGQPSVKDFKLEYAPAEFERAVPYAFSYVRLVLFGVLTLLSGGLLRLICVWWPRVFTRLARVRLPATSVGKAHYLLLLSHSDDSKEIWQEVKVHHEAPQKKKSKKKSKGMEGEEVEPDIVVPGWWQRWKIRWWLKDADELHKLDELRAEKNKRQWKDSVHVRVWFEFKQQCYELDREKNEFKRFLATVDESLDTIRKRQAQGGLSEDEVEARRERFGENRVAMDAARTLSLLFDRLSHPFYLFQFLGCAVWICQGYRIYPFVLLGLSALTVYWEVGTLTKTQRQLRKFTESGHQVPTLRNGATEFVGIKEEDLVPGDIVAVKAGFVSADLMLLQGTGVVANVAALTGDSCLVSHEAPKEAQGRIAKVAKAHPSAVLQAGSTIVGRISEDASAVVLRTGFSTARGEAFRHTLAVAAKPFEFQFERNSYRYVFVLFLLGVLGVLFHISIASENGHDFVETILSLLEVVTVVVPPMLPLVLSVGVVQTMRRLEKCGVLSSIPGCVSAGAQVTCFCFDKTGTLTQDALTLAGVVPATAKELHTEAKLLTATARASAEDDASTESSKACAYKKQFMLSPDEIPSVLQWGMAACHELNVLHPEKPTSVSKGLRSSFFGRRGSTTTTAVKTSDPMEGSMLDLAIFQASGYRGYRVDESDCFTLQETRWEGQEDPTVALNPSSESSSPANRQQLQFSHVKRFPFDPQLMRSSVVVVRRPSDGSRPGSQFLWAKGSPKSIIEICKNPPSNLLKVAKAHEARGFYCIALAAKMLSGDADLANREDYEENLAFQGLALFRNEVRPESKDVVAALTNRGISVRMITGDSVHTAVSVARKLGMLQTQRVAIVEVESSSGDVIYFYVNAAGERKRYYEDPTDTDLRPFTGFNMSRILLEHEVALSGAALELLRAECGAEAMEQLMRKVKIFARASEQKTWIVERLMKLKYVVGMCGDGTNDAGALKAAHIGLALATSSASVVAPFASHGTVVSDVLPLLQEAKCSLQSSFVVFKLMMLHPLLRACMHSVLWAYDLEFSYIQRLWNDLVVLVLTLAMLATTPALEFSSVKPPKVLSASTIVFSLLCQAVLGIFFFGAHFILLRESDTSWFCSSQDIQAFFDAEVNATESCEVYVALNSEEDSVYSFEGTSSWLFGHLLFLSIVAAFNLSDPFRRATFWTNKVFSSLFVVVLLVSLWLLMNTSESLHHSFQLMDLSSDFRSKLLAMFLTHFMAAVVCEIAARRILERGFSANSLVDDIREILQLFSKLMRKLLRRKPVEQHVVNASPGVKNVNDGDDGSDSDSDSDNDDDSTADAVRSPEEVAAVIDATEDVKDSTKSPEDENSIAESEDETKETSENDSDGDSDANSDGNKSDEGPGNDDAEEKPSHANGSFE